MPAANPILTPDRGKAHSVALAVLGALAAVQVGAMVRAVWLVQSKSDARPAASTMMAAPTRPLTFPVASPTAPSTPMLMAPPTVPNAHTSTLTAPSAASPPLAKVKSTIPAPAPTPTLTTITTTSTAKPLPKPVLPLVTSPGLTAATGPATSATSVLDSGVQELIDVAQQLRPLGDLKGALEVLQRADLKSPDHPAVLTEIALTYDQMGQRDKAAAARQKLASVGGRSGAAPQTAAASRPAETPKTLSIGTCEAIRDRSKARGERVTLRVPIRAQPGQAIDPTAIDMDVFFFDLVNGEKVEPTRADVPSKSWVDEPVDWKDGQERLDVVYSMPEMTPEAIRSIGQRKFHGYIVKLYYQHQLQDTKAEPASLLTAGAVAK